MKTKNLGVGRLRGFPAGLGGQCSAMLFAAWMATAAFGGDRQAPVAAERLIERAQRAELSGDTAQRFRWLREAVRLAPDYELARWQLGQVAVDGEWLAVEEGQRRAASDA